MVAQCVALAVQDVVVTYAIAKDTDFDHMVAGGLLFAVQYVALVFRMEMFSLPESMLGCTSVDYKLMVGRLYLRDLQ